MRRKSNECRCCSHRGKRLPPKVCDAEKTQRCHQSRSASRVSCVITEELVELSRTFRLHNYHINSLPHHVIVIRLPHWLGVIQRRQVSFKLEALLTGHFIPLNNGATCPLLRLEPRILTHPLCKEGLIPGSQLGLK